MLLLRIHDIHCAAVSRQIAQVLIMTLTKDCETSRRLWGRLRIINPLPSLSLQRGLPIIATTSVGNPTNLDLLERIDMRGVASRQAG